MAHSIPSDSPTCGSSSRKRPRNRKKKMFRPNSHDEDEGYFNEGMTAFWKNYQKASDWTKSHEIAYWRSRAAALEFENTRLRNHILKLSLNDKLPPTTSFCDTSTMNNWQSTRQCNVIFNPKVKRKRVSGSPQHTDPQLHKEANNESQLKFEVTEEMKDFLELHMRHKMEQEKKQLDVEKKRKEAAHAAGEENAKLLCQPLNFAVRTEELKVLYGDAAPMIHGMETAIQLTFRRHCEKTGARLWPNIPLRL